MMRRSAQEVAINHQAELCRQLWILRSEGVMCDVIFDVGGEELRAHRVILSACSPYLKTYCINPPTMSQDGLVQIKVERYSYKVCLKLIEFLYTGMFAKLDTSPPQEFQQLCTEWQISGVTAEIDEDEDSQSDKVTTQTLAPGKAKSSNNDALANAQTLYGSTQNSSLQEVTKIPDAATIRESLDNRSRKKSTSSHFHGGKKPRLGHDDKAQKQKDNCSGLEESKLMEPEPEPDDSDTDTSSMTVDQDQLESSTMPDEPHVKVESPERGLTAVETRVFPQNVSAECGFCGDLFETPGELDLHKKQVHKRRKDSWCKICRPKRRFPDKNLLKLHMLKSHKAEGTDPPKLLACDVS